MSVKLNIHPDLLTSKRDGWTKIEVNGITVGQCLDDLVKQLPYLDKVIFDQDSDDKTPDILIFGFRNIEGGRN